MASPAARAPGSPRWPATAPSTACAGPPTKRGNSRRWPPCSNETAQPATNEAPPSADDDIPDDRLRLIFTCCHPSIALENRVALTLRTLCGLTEPEIARAFGVPRGDDAQAAGARPRENSQRRDTLPRPLGPRTPRSGSPACLPSSSSCTPRATRPLPATSFFASPSATRPSASRGWLAQLHAR